MGGIAVSASKVFAEEDVVTDQSTTLKPFAFLKGTMLSCPVPRGFKG